MKPSGQRPESTGDIAVLLGLVGPVEAALGVTSEGLLRHCQRQMSRQPYKWQHDAHRVSSAFVTRNDRIFPLRYFGMDQKTQGYRYITKSAGFLGV